MFADHFIKRPKFAFVISLVIPTIAAAITTVWFFGGGLIDLRRLFRDLEARVDNPYDNGQVEGNVSLADVALFSDLEKNKEEKKDKE